MGDYTAEVEDPTTGEIIVIEADSLAELDALVDARLAQTGPDDGAE